MSGNYLTETPVSAYSYWNNNGAEEIVMYVTYEDVYAEPYTDFKNVKTINIPKADVNKIFQKLSDYIDDDFLGRLVKIDFSDVHQDNNLWFTIYDKNGRC